MTKLTDKQIISKAMSILAARGRGIPKRLTPEERQRRSEHMRRVNELINARYASGEVKRTDRGKDKKPRVRRWYRKPEGVGL